MVPYCSGQCGWWEGCIWFNQCCTKLCNTLPNHASEISVWDMIFDYEASKLCFEYGFLLELVSVMSRCASLLETNTSCMSVTSTKVTEKKRIYWEIQFVQPNLSQKTTYWSSQSCLSPSIRLVPVFLRKQHLLEGSTLTKKAIVLKQWAATRGFLEWNVLLRYTAVVG